MGRKQLLPWRRLAAAQVDAYYALRTGFDAKQQVRKYHKCLRKEEEKTAQLPH